MKISPKVWNQFAPGEKAIFTLLHHSGYGAAHIKQYLKAARAFFKKEYSFTDSMGLIVSDGNVYEWSGGEHYYTENFAYRGRR